MTESTERFEREPSVQAAGMQLLWTRLRDILAVLHAGLERLAALLGDSVQRAECQRLARKLKRIKEDLDECPDRLPGLLPLPKEKQGS